MLLCWHLHGNVSWNCRPSCPLFLLPSMIVRLPEQVSFQNLQKIIFLLIADFIQITIIVFLLIFVTVKQSIPLIDIMYTYSTIKQIHRHNNKGDPFQIQLLCFVLHSVVLNIKLVYHVHCII